MKIHIKTFFFILLTLLTKSLGAQTYPVTVTTQIIPPYSLFLSEYASPTNDKLIAYILLNDKNEPTYNIKLRLTIEGVGIKVETKPNFSPAPIIINSGVMEKFSGADLAEYFNPDNLIFSGITKDQYIKNAALPEGLYQFCITVVDYQKNVDISNTGCAMAWIMRNNPPVLISPPNLSRVQAADPQQILFQWAPMHTGSPNSAFTTDYILRLVEVWPATRNPNDAINTTQPILEETTKSTSFKYGPDQTPLVPGRTYAYQVQAIDLSGNDLFKNNGKSEVYTFVYVEDCAVPLNISKNVDGPNRATVEWDPALNHLKFNVRYREKNNTTATWFTSTTTSPKVALSDLKPAKIYEYQIQAACSTGVSLFSSADTLMTASSSSDGYTECSSKQMLEAIQDQSLLASLTINDKIKLGLFDMKVTELTGGNGIYTGKGEVDVPLFSTKMKVSFDNIKVNNDKRMFEGKVYVDRDDLKEVDKLPALRKDICQSKEETEASSTTTGQTSSGNKSDTLVSYGGVVIHPGDTIILNGNKTVVTSDTKFKEGDQVGVNGQTHVLTSGDIKKPSSGTSSSPQSDISKVSKSLDKKISSALKEIKKTNDDKIKSGKKEVKDYSAELEALIVKNKFDRFLIVGENNEYIGEGMSENLKVKTKEEVLEQGSEVAALKNKHIQLYKADSALVVCKKKDPIIVGQAADDKIDALVIQLEDSLKKLNQNVIDDYAKNSDKLNEFILKFVDDKIQQLYLQSTNSSGKNYNLFNQENFVCLNSKTELDKFLVIPYISAEVNNVNNTETASSKLASHARAVCQKVVEDQKFKSASNKDKTVSLPFGILKQIGVNNYVVAIDSIVFTPTDAFLSAYISIEDPLTESQFLFAGSNIEFHPGGIDAGTGSRLSLIEDVPIRLGNKLKLTIQAEGQKTFVSWDCNGFKSLGVKGEFEFCRDVLIPERPDGSLAPEPERVKASFETEIPEWGDIIAKVNFTPFQISGLDGFGFVVKDAWVDFSDLKNPTGITFPSGYNVGSGNEANLWHGFFIKQLAVKLPSQFESIDNSGRKEFGGYNMIIDKMGFSGDIYAKNIISIDKGSIGGWPFSLDSITLSLQKNQLKAGSLKGRMNVPIFKEDTQLGYSASIVSENGSTNYYFNVSNKDTVSMPVWKANVQLLPSSYIDINVVNKKFQPKAHLNGNINIDLDFGGGNSSKMVGISFEELEVVSVKPYIHSGRWSLSSLSLSKKKADTDQKLAGFPLTVKEVKAVEHNDGAVGIYFDVALNLVKDSEGGFAAETSFEVLGKLDFSDGVRHWFKYDKTVMDEVKIDVDGGAFKIKGRLKFYDKNQVYGNGFKGTVDATFTPGVQVSATAQFGNVNNFRYWFADGMLSVPTGIPIFPGFGLYGFGGGAYHHMRQQNFSNVKKPDPGVASTLIDNSTQPGMTVSGVKYVPDENFYLGIKATVVVGVYPEPAPFNGDVTFEIAFNNSGGVNTISFQGDGYFMCKPTEKSKNAAVMAGVFISYDFTNKVLHGNLDVYVNVVGVLKGAHPGNLAGSAVLHIESSDWYIYIGTPSKRVEVVAAGLFNLNSYFMVGSIIEPMPPPPSNVSDILGGMDLNMMRDENAIAKGGGFAFGSAMSFSTGDLTFLMFYATFDAGMGFDIMLRNYGQVHCAGRSGVLGINGWYASGQAYAYLEGDIGIEVKVFGSKKHVKILEIGAAAVLQAKLPNPTWMRGVVGGYFSVLNGLVKGHCKFQVTIGEECQIQDGSIVASIKVISDMSPADKGKDISVFTSPQVVFNLPIDKSFDLVDLDEQVKSYRIVLSYVKVLDGTTEIPGYLEWDSKKEVVAFNAYDILPPNKQLKAMVRIYFEQNQGGAWNPVVVSGKVVDETQEINFQTGNAPDYIPASNVVYSYPMTNQLNYYKGESTDGYIQLKMGQPYLFQPSDEWKQVLRFTVAGSTSQSDLSLNYDGRERKINYTIPSSLTNDRVYSLTIVNVPKVSNAAVNANVVAQSKGLGGDTTGSATIEEKGLQGDLKKLSEKEIFSLNFKTSKYNSLKEKLTALKTSEGWRMPVLNYVGVQDIGVTVQGNELFDMYEIQGGQGSDPLIKFEAKLTNPWHYNYLFPLVYQDYPIDPSMTITWRDPQGLGLVPVKAIVIRQEDMQRILTETEIGSGVLPFDGYANVTYQMPYYGYRDYYELQQKAAAKLVKDYVLSDRIKYLLLTSYPSILKGSYEVRIQYSLPGTGKITSVQSITINCP